MAYPEKSNNPHPAGKAEPPLGSLDHLKWSYDISQAKRPKEPSVGEAAKALANAVVRAINDQLKNL